MQIIVAICLLTGLISMGIGFVTTLVLLLDAIILCMRRLREKETKESFLDRHFTKIVKINLTIVLVGFVLGFGSLLFLPDIINQYIQFT